MGLMKRIDIDVFYNGTGNPNKMLIPHLHYLKE